MSINVNNLLRFDILHISTQFLSFIDLKAK